MNLIIKHTLKSAVKNKMQAGIILLTVIFVTAMIFTAYSLSNVFYMMNSAEHRRLAMDTDMMVGSGEWFASDFDISDVDSLLDEGDVEYVDYFMRTRSIATMTKDTKVVMLDATNLNEYLSRHTLKVISSADFPQSTGEEIPPIYPAVIGERFAKDNNIKAGDSLRIYVRAINDYSTVFITMICENQGFFATDYPNILTDFSAISVSGKSNGAYIKFTDSSLFSKYQQIFSKAEFTVSNAQSSSYAKDTSQNITMLFSIAIIFIVAAMMLILLTSYLIIARHRISDMIIFKAAGATPLQTTLIMLAEVLVYSCLGAFFGLMLGRFFLGVAVNSLLPSGSYILTFDIKKYLVSFFTSVLVCLAACLIPIIKSSRKTIRELGASPIKIAKNPNRMVAAVLLVITTACIITLSFLSGRQIVALSVFLIVSASALIAFTAPIIIRLFAIIFSKIFVAGSLALSCKTARKNKGLHTMSILLAVLIAFSFMVYQLIGVVQNTTTPYLARFNADFVGCRELGLTADENIQIQNKLKSVDGVRDVGYMLHTYFALDDKGNDITLYGVSDNTTLKSVTSGLSKAAMDRWDKTPKAIVLNSDTMLKHNLKIGDTILLLSVNNQNEDMDFVIVGADKTATEWDGIGYIKHTALPEGWYGTTFLIDAQNGVDKNELFLRLRQTTEDLTVNTDGNPSQIKGLYVLKTDEWVNAGQKNLTGLNKLLSYLQIFLFLVCFFGIINISVVTVYDRRQELAVYNLCGMNKKDYFWLSFGEGLLIVLSGGFMGFLLCCAFNAALPAFVSIINRFISFSFLPAAGGIIIGVSCLLVLLNWITAAILKRFKRDGQINRRFT